MKRLVINIFGQRVGHRLVQSGRYDALGKASGRRDQLGTHDVTSRVVGGWCTASLMPDAATDDVRAAAGVQ